VGAAVNARDEESRLRGEITDLVRRIVEVRGRKDFVPGETDVVYAGRVFDAEELVAAVQSSLDAWLTLGPEGDAFEARLADILGVRWTRLTNSGSSANLVAIAALTSPKVKGRLRAGDEVITVAAGFPTTVAPIVQTGLVPVFLDSDPETGNVRLDALEQALSPRTRAVMIAHTLGNPFDLDAVTAFCREHDLWLVEDNCDALGSTWDGRPTGSFGDLSTQSFYPAHHLTMGEGGSVNIASSGALKVAVESVRDWGRDCWCPTGKSDSCGKRYRWCLGDLPEGYDHKYVYSHLGYNLKPLDLSAAIGRVQLEKLDAFTAARRANHAALAEAIAPYGDVLRTFAAHGKADPSWFGFALVVQPGAPFTRADLVRHLEGRRVHTRMLFGGNLVRQPAFVQLLADAAEDGRPAPYRVVGDLAGADRLMRDALFVGVYPGIDAPRRAWMVEALTDFLREHTGR
jgi:CDP-6-deoxy-D-xylo-4-hexulose-3-dehydrase